MRAPLSMLPALWALTQSPPVVEGIFRLIKLFFWPQHFFFATIFLLLCITLLHAVVRNNQTFSLWRKKKKGVFAWEAEIMSFLDICCGQVEHNTRSRPGLHDCSGMNLELLASRSVCNSPRNVWPHFCTCLCDDTTLHMFQLLPQASVPRGHVQDVSLVSLGSTHVNWAVCFFAIFVERWSLYKNLAYETRLYIAVLLKRDEYWMTLSCFPFCSVNAFLIVVTGYWRLYKDQQTQSLEKQIHWVWTLY